MAKQFTDRPEFMKELAQDEKILWKGIPEDFPLMSDEVKKNITKRWLGCIIAAVVLIVAYILLNLSLSGGINVALLIIALLVVAYLAYVPVMDKNSVQKKIKYYISDRRVLIDYAEKDVYALPRAGLKSEIIDAGEGCIHIALGSSVGTKVKKRRVAAIMPDKDDNGIVTGMFIYNVEDSTELRSLF